MPRDAAVEPAHCHGLLARLVEDPGRFASNRAACRSDDGFDLERLRLLSGLVTKVRHNPVRARLPLTVRALEIAGLDLDFFAAHAVEFGSRRRGGLTDDERTDLFVDALRDWLSGSDGTHRMVADVLDHELTLLAIADEPPVPAPERDAHVHPDSHPRLRGVRLLHLTVHPPDVAELGATLGSLDRTDRLYAYIPTPTGPRVKSVAFELAPLLMLADGSMTVGGIAAALGVDTPLDQVVEVYALLVHGGLLTAENRCG